MSFVNTEVGSEQSDAEMLDLRAIFELLLRQIRLIGLTFAIVLGVAIIYLITATPMYTARALLIVDPAKRNLMEAQQSGSLNAQIDNSIIDSEVEIIRSPATALAVIEAAQLIKDQEFGPSVGFVTRIKIALGLLSDETPKQDLVLQGVIKKLNNAVAVKRLGMTYLISVDATSKDPARAAFIANTLAKTYITNQVQSKINASLYARDVLQKQAEAGREAVAASDEALDQFIEENLLALEEDAGSPQVTELRTLLEARRAQLSLRESDLRAATIAAQQGNFEAIAQSLANDALNELLTQREAIAAQLQEAAEGSQDLIDLQAELAGIEDEFQSNANEAILTLASKVAAQNNELDSLQGELRSTLLQGDLSSKFLAQIFELQQAATNTRNQYQNIVARLAEVSNQAALQVAQSRVVSEALQPTSKSAPNTRSIVVLALVAGLGLGVALAFLNEYYIGGIVSAAQLEQLTGLQVASVVPALPNPEGNGVSAKVVKEPLSNYSESIRRLRAVLDHDFRSKLRGLHSSTQEDTGRVVVKNQQHANFAANGSVIIVTSAVPAEGKSSLSLSLARNYAMNNLKVIIVDADLRKPSLAQNMGLKTSVGIIDFLINPNSANVLSNFGLIRDPLSTLDCILGSGRAKIPTDQLFSSSSFDQLILDMKRMYDIVILDTAPLLPVVDTRYIIHHADAIVMPVRWAMTNQSDVRGALSIMKSIIGKNVNLHLVLSQSEQNTDGYYGYKYRYNGYYGKR